jgi:hypothetical protein
MSKFELIPWIYIHSILPVVYCTSIALFKFCKIQMKNSLYKLNYNIKSKFLQGQQSFPQYCLQKCRLWNGAWREMVCVRGEYKGNHLASNKCGKLGQTVQDQNGISMEWFMTPTKLSHLNNSMIQIPFTRQFFFHQFLFIFGWV